MIGKNAFFAAMRGGLPCSFRSSTVWPATIIASTPGSASVRVRSRRCASGECRKRSPFLGLGDERFQREHDDLSSRVRTAEDLDVRELGDRREFRDLVSREHPQGGRRGLIGQVGVVVNEKRLEAVEEPPEICLRKGSARQVRGPFVSNWKNLGLDRRQYLQYSPAYDRFRKREKRARGGLGEDSGEDLGWRQRAMLVEQRLP